MSEIENRSTDVPDPASVVSAAQDPTINNDNTSAMHLFAPDPNTTEENSSLALDELFDDCYFGEIPVIPEGVPSSTDAGVTAIASSFDFPRTSNEPTVATAPKRTADQAGLAKDAVTSISTSAASKAPVGGCGEEPSNQPASSLSETQKVERRTRNREHARRSRIRKKFLLQSLQEQMDGLQGEASALRAIIKRELPDRAESLLRSVGAGPEEVSAPGKGSYTPFSIPSGFGRDGKRVRTLMAPDYRLMSALSGSQQNFAISDPSLPDNPIVYVSQGFLDLTGYSLEQVLGRNCRFLQGPGTDQAAVEVIRRGISEGTDTSVCLLNYKADGTPFWNQFFVAGLRDAEDNVVNYVGVQCEVSRAVVEKHISEGKTPPSPLT